MITTDRYRLVDDLSSTPGVSLGHMSCLGNSESDDQDITFLYTLAPGELLEISQGPGVCVLHIGRPQTKILFHFPHILAGACPKSFGFNAARMAGISGKVIEEAKTVAQEFERTSDKFHLFAKILSSTSQDMGTICKKIAAIL